MAIKISVGIPIYRVGSRVEFCIQSVLNQSRPADEIVIVDNLVSRSKSCAQRWTTNPRVKYINSQQNVGAIANFLRAWDFSTHRYFTWVSDDDFLHPEALAAYELSVEQSRDYDFIAWCGLPSVFYSSGGARVTGNRFPSFEASSFVERVSLICRYGQWNYPFYSMYDRSLLCIDWFRKFNDWPFGTSSIDWSWTYAVAAHGCIKLIPSHLYFKNQDNWALGDDLKPKQINPSAINLVQYTSRILLPEEINTLSINIMSFLFVISSFQSSLVPADINSLFHIFFLTTYSPSSTILRSCYEKLECGSHVSPRYLLTLILESLEQAKPGFIEEIRSFGFSDQVQNSVSNRSVRAYDTIWGQPLWYKTVRKFSLNYILNKAAYQNIDGEMIILPKP